jgi:hypothetical protein
MKAMRDFSFRGYYVAAVAAGILLSYGIELLVATVRDPLAGWIVDAINFVIRVGRFDVVSLEHHQSSWEIAAYTGVGALVALVAGFWLGAWAGKTDASRR